MIEFSFAFYELNQVSLYSAATIFLVMISQEFSLLFLFEHVNQTGTELSHFDSLGSILTSHKPGNVDLFLVIEF